MSLVNIEAIKSCFEFLGKLLTMETMQKILIICTLAKCPAIFTGKMAIQNRIYKPSN